MQPDKNGFSQLVMGVFTRVFARVTETVEVNKIELKIKTDLII